MYLLLSKASALVTLGLTGSVSLAFSYTFGSIANVENARFV